jgi:NADPH:quinone reductase-like Zn-dependent oxidoreductase
VEVKLRAAVMREWGGPSVLQIEDVPEPEMTPDGVLIEIKACGIAYHDVVQRNGAMKRGTNLPMILGYEVGGIVESVGPLVRDFKKGDRVCNKPWHSCGDCRYCRTGMETSCVRRRVVHGGYAERVVFPSEVLVKVPDSLPLDAACMLGASAGVALNAVRDVAKIRLGETILITGASGGVGRPCVELARAAGATVIAVSRSAEKVEPLMATGAHHVIVAEDGKDYSAQIKQLTDGRGVDIVVDNVGSRAFSASFKSLALGGRYVMVGQLFREDITINPAFIFFQRAQILGVGSTRRDQLEDVVALAAKGVIKPIVAKVFPLDQIAEAHALAERGDVFGRVVIHP